MTRSLCAFFAGLGFALTTAASSGSASADDIVLTSRLHHLRQIEPREWSTFPEQAETTKLELKFEAKAAARERCLSLRQQDVKETWTVSLNGESLGKLHINENDMRVYYEVGFDLVKNGENTLTIECPKGRSPDDIRVGEITLLDRKKRGLLSEATLDVTVTEPLLIRVADMPDDDREYLRRVDALKKFSREPLRGVALEQRWLEVLREGTDKLPVPCRITILNSDGSLQECLAESEKQVAFRPGTVYAANRPVRILLPAGDYRVLAGRGFEYSLAAEDVSIPVNATQQLSLSIKREVDTEGWVACDTHVHTLTHSGHGDSTVQERMVTLAGEGIELPIATDHNVFIDHRPFAKEAGVARYFTPVIGNEVTTRVGHFNVFPVTPGAQLPDHKLTDWDEIADSINQVAGVKVVILNHARDIHSGVRPFGPALFNDAVGENIEGWRFRANAMETANSSANQTDIMQMFRDWMTMLNRGLNITPVGCSDSHDVSRHFVGQGRTYIRCDDRDPGNIDVEQAVDSFVQGRVMVSYGLLTKLTVNDRYGPGELARVGGDTVKVNVSVQGPHWTTASRLQLFANGVPIRESTMSTPEESTPAQSFNWQTEWVIARPNHDVHLVAIATGPGITGPHWKTALPYQPTSPDFEPTSLGCSGAVWLDVDGDGRRSSARDYAEYVNGASGEKIDALLEKLERYDEATAAQAAFVFHRQTGLDKQNLFLSSDVQTIVRGASPHVRNGIQKYVDAWRRSQIAAAE
ncbi:MAG: CehA/McbA family metallohydrolase [Planctomycetota bacterium]|nr:CehA/McbA family metallohydrolase [Planctomycetota bacterium]